MMEERSEELDSGDLDDLKYPYVVILIIGNEFCERFSFYGMRSILTLYLLHILLYSEKTATIIFHIFSMACYFTPVIGAWIADSWLGKYKTIFYISIIYAIGNMIIAVGSIPFGVQEMAITSLLGLALIAFGTGGIKPCVSAFGGDQFLPGQEVYLKQFFSWFYLVINLGAVISTAVAPLLRSGVHCFNQNSCYPLAFGVPALLMIVAIVLFILGKSKYRIIPPSGNIIAEVFKCIKHALIRKMKMKDETKKHWLEFADDKFDPEFIRDVRVVLHVLFLYIPLPVFWALFDQQGSRWVLQADRMSRELGGFYIIPEQMQVVNPILIILLIPTFEYFVYPLMSKCNFLVKPLQRMVFGGMLAALSFTITGFLQLLINSHPSSLSGNNKLIVINNSPCNFTLSGSFKADLLPFQNFYIDEVVGGNNYTWKFQPEDCSLGQLSETYYWVASFSREIIMVTISQGKVMVFNNLLTLGEDTSDIQGSFQFFFNFQNELAAGNMISFSLKGPSSYAFQSNITRPALVGITNAINDIYPGDYKIYLTFDDVKKKESLGSINVKYGGHYVFGVYEENTTQQKVTTTLFYLYGNNIPMVYQVIQYLFMTCGEIMMSITGLEFSYSQAPASMKAVLQAAWLLTISVGNLIVVIIAEIKLFDNQAYEFFMFAFLMFLDILIFAIMAHYYTYVKIDDMESHHVSQEETNVWKSDGSSEDNSGRK